MSKTLPTPHDNNIDWQLLTEFLVPNLQETRAEIVNHVANVLHQYGLDPGQQDHVQAAISQSLQSVEGASTPLRLRISISGANLTETWPEMYYESTQGSDQGSQPSGGGLGFFLVKRFVGQLQDQDPRRYRLVEVLLYRE